MKSSAPILMPLHEINDKQLGQFLELVKNPEIMEHIGNHAIWDDEYVKGLIISSLTDVEEQPIMKKRKYVHWAIILNNNFIGYVALKPSIGKIYPDYQLRIFISPEHQGCGYGTHVLRLISTMPELKGKKIWLFSKNPVAIKLFNHLLMRANDVVLHKLIHSSFYFVVQ